MRAKLRELSPNDHHVVWQQVRHAIEPLLIGRFELSSLSHEKPLRKLFQHVLLHLADLPNHLVKAIGAFLSTLVQRVDNELPTARLISRLLATPPPSLTTPPLIPTLTKDKSFILLTSSAQPSSTP